jgi:hypothetical protein
LKQPINTSQFPTIEVPELARIATENRVHIVLIAFHRLNTSNISVATVPAPNSKTSSSSQFQDYLELENLFEFEDDLESKGTRPVLGKRKSGRKFTNTSKRWKNIPASLASVDLPPNEHVCPSFTG